MMFDEVTAKPRTLFLHEINKKLHEIKEEYGNITIQFNFGSYPTEIVNSDFPNEYFLNYSETPTKINRLINQIDIIEEDLFIYSNYEEILFDTETYVGISDTYETENQNISILDIFVDGDMAIFETEQNSISNHLTFF